MMASIWLAAGLTPHHLTSEKGFIKDSTMITAAVFAAALALPAFAQVGAGIAGNGTVGEEPAPMGANPDIANSDRTQTSLGHLKAAAPAPVMPPSQRADRHSKVVESDRNSGVGVNAGVNPSESSAGANAGTDNSPTGGY